VNFLEAQARNRRGTFRLVGLLALVLAAACWALQIYLTGDVRLYGSPAEILAHPPLIAFGAFGFSLAYAGGSYFWGGRAILMASGARHADPANPREKQFINVLEETAIAAGLPAPQAWILADSDLNAFATGRDPAHAAIAVTEGLLDRLSREELQGVVGHEMAHIKNRDTLLMLFVACMLGAILLIAEIMVRGSRGLRLRSGNRRGGGQAALLGLLAMMVAWILGQLVGRIVAMAVSREREYLADATGAELTRNPEALARALSKIRAAVHPTLSAHPATAPLFIEDPAGHALNEREGAFANLFSTHPPMKQRIQRLRAMAFAGLKRERRANGLDPLTGEPP